MDATDEVEVGEWTCAEVRYIGVYWTEPLRRHNTRICHCNTPQWAIPNTKYINPSIAYEHMNQTTAIIITS